MVSLLPLQLLYEEVMSHGSLLETIGKKGSGMAEHYVTRLEVQELQDHYAAIKEKSKVVGVTLSREEQQIKELINQRVGFTSVCIWITCRFLCLVREFVP